MIMRSWEIPSPRTWFQAVSAVFLAAAFSMSESSSIERDRAGVPAVPVTADAHDTRLKLDEAIAQDIAGNIEPARPDMAASATELGAPEIDQAQKYLWSVYQRSSAKLDSHGDFTWKDVAAAARLGLSVEEYVIGGMDPDFREQLFAAGQALDAAGIGWTILSAFRDDYRQNLAVGFRASVGNSFHGGSAATGGYGHGCAVDLASTDGLSNSIVWNWLDQYGEEFGLHRPLRRIDPAHVQPSAGWHDLGSRLRNERVDVPSVASAPNTIGSDFGEPIAASFAVHSSTAGVSEEQFNCMRPRPAEELHAEGIPTHMKVVITARRVSGEERNRSKAAWRTAGRITEHSVSTRRFRSDNVGSHAKLKAGLRLAG
jgi:hypothetical protein